MAKRFYDTGLVDQEWYMSLPPKYKALYIHLLCKCDVAGVFEANYRIMGAYIGEEIVEDDVFCAFGKRVIPLVKSENKGILVDFVHFQCGGCVNPKVKAHQAILRRMKELGITKEELIEWCNHDLIFMDDESAGDASIDLKLEGQGNKAERARQPSDDRAVKIGECFSRFWAKYPRHDAKKVAYARFASAMKNLSLEEMDRLTDTIIEKVGILSSSEQWIKDGGKFIPMATTWLNQRRWEDEGIIGSQENRQESANTLAQQIAKAVRI